MRFPVLVLLAMITVSCVPPKPEPPVKTRKEMDKMFSDAAKRKGWNKRDNDVLHPPKGFRQY